MHSCMGVCVNAYEREKNGGWYIGIDYIPCSHATNEQDDFLCEYLSSLEAHSLKCCSADVSLVSVVGQANHQPAR